MDFSLSPVEVRVLGCLVEKAITTPEVYPLTLNSLVAACNQRTNRNPVVDYDPDTITAALDELRDLGLVRRVDTAGGRAAKFRHILPDAIPVNDAQLAILCVLLLRGPQTVGELRARTDRLHTFRDLDEVEDTVKELVQPPDGSPLDEPLAIPLPLRPGSREVRFAHLLGEALPILEEGPVEQPIAPAVQPRATREEVDALREEVASLRSQLEELRADFDSLKAELT